MKTSMGDRDTYVHQACAGNERNLVINEMRELCAERRSNPTALAKHSELVRIPFRTWCIMHTIETPTTLVLLHPTY